WADLMATGRQFNWPPAGNFVAAYGQFFMAANTIHSYRKTTGQQARAGLAASFTRGGASEGDI
ncbi:hypothetical protein, partial [Pseudarthrobacter sulfonivorans]|uniref:hypothetical protein n=1 Tax=Pseudarthrobacter sulfonivorans TaxID=121292 RepID=UPI0027D8E2E8